MALALAMAVVLADAAVGFAHAQRSDGWFGRLTNRPPAQSEAEVLDAREQAEAARLYGDAQKSVEQGHLHDARNRLELLLARYPTSHLIDAARRDLRSIYERLASQLSPLPAAPPAHPSQAVLDGFNIAGQVRPGQSGPAQPGPAQPGPAQPGPAQPGFPTPSIAADAPPATRRLVPPATNPAAKAIDFLKDEFRNTAGDRIFFTDGSADFGTRARVGLEAQAIWLRRNPGVSVIIEGHADDGGTREFNHELSRRRAEATKAKLVELGIEAGRIDVLALGRDRPVSNCDAPACASHNRLVLTTINRVAVAASP